MNNKEFAPITSPDVDLHDKPQLSITTLALDYHPQLAHDLFAPIEMQPWSILLRSASTTHTDSRFDILTAAPIATLLTKTIELNEVAKPITFVSFSDSNKTDIQSTADPFALLAHYQQQLLPDIDCSLDLPFIGGALGYFSYDLGHHIEPQKVLTVAANHSDLTIADMAIGLYDWALIVDHHLKQAVIVASDEVKAKCRLSWLQSHQSQQNHVVPFKLTSSWQSNMSRADYQTKFEQIQAYLQAGDCYQINLAQRFNAHYCGSEWQAYLHLEASNQAPFSAFMRTPECAILSVSPERFLSLEHRHIETKPIKGTRPRSSDPIIDQQYAEQLRHALKDQAENLMIVDLLRNDIGKVAQIGTVEVPKLFDIESFPAVHHLVSTVHAQLDDRYQACDLLRSCFPGGSITGAPKIRAMQIIEELEPDHRTVYCGSIAYISRHQRMDSSITIRTLVAHQQQLYAWAGGGIVADSQCDAEYQETLDKLNKVLPILTQA